MAIQGTKKAAEKKAETTGDKGKLSHEQFVKKAIVALRAGGYKDKKTGQIVYGKGIHCVYSGFNEAFKRYFGTDAKDIVNTLAEKDVIDIRPARKGVMLYLAGEAPERTDTDKRAEDNIAKILG